MRGKKSRERRRIKEKAKGRKKSREGRRITNRRVERKARSEKCRQGRSKRKEKKKP